MHLTRSQQESFYRIFYSLIDYCNKRLELIDDPSFPWSPDCDPHDVSEVAEYIWSNTSIIDDYIKDNPAKLDKQHLNQVAQWKYGIGDRFFLVRHDAVHSLLMSNDCIFAIIGLSRELSEMLQTTPDIVDTIILPFEGRLVYATNIASYSQLSLGPSICKSIQEEFSDLLNAGRLVVSADDLIAEYPLYIERAGKKAIDELLRDIEDASDLEVPIPNTHRGALADLTSEERENAIQKHISEETAGSILNTYLSDASLKHKPEQSLEKCLNSLTKKDLLRIANNLQLSRTSKLKKAELASVIAAEITTNPLAVSELLDYAYIGAIDSIQHAVESHNATEIADQTATDYKYLLPFVPLSFLFSHNGEYFYVIPKEIFRVLQTLDWEQLKKKRTKQTKLAHFIEAQVDVCGIIYLEDINRACNGFFDDAISANDINDVLAMQLKVEYPLFQQACIDNVEYLITDAFQPLPYIQSNVLTAFVDDRYKDKWEELGSNIQDSVLCLDILNAQAGKPARLLTKNDFSNYDIDQFDIMRLIEEKPSFMAFRAYLDERVPDDEDDYYYADSLLEKICMAIQYGTPIEKTFEFLLDSGVCVENIAQVNQLFGLFANFYNDIPQWNNHGWSPNELHEMRAKKPAKNKVGRNDPCPCGSGKKYKRCCGR